MKRLWILPLLALTSCASINYHYMDNQCENVGTIVMSDGKFTLLRCRPVVEQVRETPQRPEDPSLRDNYEGRGRKQ